MLCARAGKSAAEDEAIIWLVGLYWIRISPSGKRQRAKERERKSPMGLRGVH